RAIRHRVCRADVAVDCRSRPGCLEHEEGSETGGTDCGPRLQPRANAWEPAPPPEFALFYSAFLAWRQANGWDNQMADHLPELFRSAGLAEVDSRIQDEVVQRGNPDFVEQSTLWSDVIGNIGEQLAQTGFCNALQLHEARQSYDAWVK